MLVLYTQKNELFFLKTWLFLYKILGWKKIHCGFTDGRYRRTTQNIVCIWCSQNIKKTVRLASYQKRNEGCSDKRKRSAIGPWQTFTLQAPYYAIKALFGAILQLQLSVLSIDSWLSSLPAPQNFLNFEDLYSFITVMICEPIPRVKLTHCMKRLSY